MVLPCGERVKDALYYKKYNEYLAEVEVYETRDRFIRNLGDYEVEGVDTSTLLDWPTPAPDRTLEQRFDDDYFNPIDNYQIKKEKYFYKQDHTMLSKKYEYRSKLKKYSLDIANSNNFSNDKIDSGNITSDISNTEPILDINNTISDLNINNSISNYYI